MKIDNQFRVFCSLLINQCKIDSLTAYQGGIGALKSWISLWICPSTKVMIRVSLTDKWNIYYGGFAGAQHVFLSKILRTHFMKKILNIYNWITEEEISNRCKTKICTGRMHLSIIKRSANWFWLALLQRVIVLCQSMWKKCLHYFFLFFFTTRTFLLVTRRERERERKQNGIRVM